MTDHTLRTQIALTIQCPIDTCLSPPNAPCELLFQRELENNRQDIIHLERYAQAKRSRESRLEHDPGDEDHAQP